MTATGRPPCLFPAGSNVSPAPSERARPKLPVMEALLTAIQGVDCAARRCAAALAVLGAGAPVAAAAGVAGLDVEPAERAADRLAAAGLFGARRPLAFASPELRVATYA